jgi:hypothetical protein
MQLIDEIINIVSPKNEQVSIMIREKKILVIVQRHETVALLTAGISKEEKIVPRK